MLEEHCDGITIREVDAGNYLVNKCAFILNYFWFDPNLPFLFDLGIIGHCPHDEVPDQVNPIICQWILDAESKISAECAV